MKKSYIYILFGLMVIAQIAASAQIVYKYEKTIASDSVFKFRTAPIDPSDPFRGKSIILNFDIDRYETSDDSWEDSKTRYAYFSKDEYGYAVLETVSKELLADSNFEYVEVEIYNYYGDAVHFNLPFDTYYMEESKAYDAEVLYRENNRNEKQQDVYAVVHIKDGTYVLTDVIIDGVSIKDAVAK
ncbi:GDYXXLXY domain-containing protein [Kordia sp. YSTF-M3]|uniref:GDYXXLXY domain-containing protein n=1 Tax=Kordia aestuariivivens TaxID=2759037 RepID=A0ABR7QDP3_9FLAO|nr:GDYXXLXY domain-containing protein [Kordia aestuariivivens]MBC8756667.1 GDYXXLXY domain-containing protein [Kordia aestuariivivens]